MKKGGWTRRHVGWRKTTKGQADKKEGGRRGEGKKKKEEEERAHLAQLSLC